MPICFVLYLFCLKSRVFCLFMDTVATVFLNSYFYLLTAHCTDLRFSTCEEVLSYDRTYFPNPTALDRDSAISLIEETSILEECHEDFLLLFCSMLFADCPHGGPSRRPCKALCEEVTDACRESYKALMDEDWPIDCRQLSDDENLEESYCIGGEGGKLLARFRFPPLQVHSHVFRNVQHWQDLFCLVRLIGDISLISILVPCLSLTQI